MEIKELVPKLVEHYQRCIDEIIEDGWHSYLLDNRVGCGICLASSVLFNTWIYGSNFIEQFTNGLDYACTTPLDAKSYSEAKELLQIRLNRLREFL